MIWYIGLFVCAVVAFFLAWRSLRDFQEDPETKNTDYGLFLIGNLKGFDDELFQKLIQSVKGYICSLEKIQKGSSEAVVGFFPYFVVSQFPALGLIEIEDYILGRGQSEEDPFILSRQITLDDSFAWKLQSKKPSGPLEKNSLNLELTPDQYVAWQIVFEPIEDKLQITSRVIVKEPNPQQKISLIKQVKKAIEKQTSLSSGLSLMHAGVYEEYKKRALIPKQVQSWLIEPHLVKNFILK